jgi:hypothetical protein
LKGKQHVGISLRFIRAFDVIRDRDDALRRDRDDALRRLREEREVAAMWRWLRRRRPPQVLH